MPRAPRKKEESLLKILIVEDERDLVLGLKDNLELEGYQVSVAYDGESGLQAALTETPDLILLDVMLPKLSGLDLCRRLRAKGANTLVIMLTARGTEIEKVVGLETGADDYITKPFGLNELLARIRALFRRAQRHTADVEWFGFGDIQLDFRKYHASKGGKPLDLSPREFAMLKFLVQHREETVTREQLLDHVWGVENYPFTRTVDNHVAKLRQKIEESPSTPRHIITVHRIGYRFMP
jgi:DNA-binding response OmpR family regulator